MTLTDFAHRHRLKVRLDACGDPVIAGKRGQVYEYGSGLLAAMYMGLPNHSGGWRKLKALLRPLAGKPLQDGDCEGTVLFDPRHAPIVKTVFKGLRIKAKRQISPEQRARMMEQLAKARGRQ